MPRLHHALAGLHGEGGVAGNRLGELHRSVEHLLAAHHPVDQAPLQCGGRIDLGAGQDPLQGDRLRNPVGQAQHAALGREHAVAHFRESQHSILCCDSEVAGHHDLRATTEGVAVDSRHQGLGEQPSGEAAEPALPLVPADQAPASGHLLEIGS